MESRKQIIRILAGAAIEVLGVRHGPEGRPMAEVRWLGKILEMFAEDIERRGETILTQGAAK